MTTPEPPVHTGEVVPFGKYKGQPIEVLFADPSYREWVLSQPWVRDRYATFHQVIINYGGEPQDSPEHNQMQASFLDDERCFRLAKLLWPRRAWATETALDGEPRAIALMRTYPQHVTADWHGADLIGRRFESDGWDVVYGLEPPGAEVGMLSDNPIPCTCPPCDHTSCPPPRDWHQYVPARSPVRVGGAFHWPCTQCPDDRYGTSHSPPRCLHDRHEAHRERSMASWVAPGGRPSFAAWTHCGESCPYADQWLCDWLNQSRGGHWYQPQWHGLVRVECKPDLGDDFPTVLRQVLRYPREPSDRVCVLVRRARFQAVTWQQVVDMFAASKVRLIQESDLSPVQAIAAAGDR